MEKTKFNRTYEILNEVFNAVTHGIGTGLSIAGLVVLLVKGAHLHSSLHIVSYAIYGSMKKVFQVFDHSSIFLLIAGSYTPFCLLSIRGWLGWTLFVLIWLFAILGIIYKALTLHKRERVSKVSTIIYIFIGWLCVVAAVPLYHSLGMTGVILMVAGGLSYTIGAFFYSLNSIRYMHVVWHLFVMLGAGFMYFSVLFFT